MEDRRIARYEDFITLFEQVAGLERSQAADPTCDGAAFVQQFSHPTVRGLTITFAYYVREEDWPDVKILVELRNESQRQSCDVWYDVAEGPRGLPYGRFYGSDEELVRATWSIPVAETDRLPRVFQPFFLEDAEDYLPRGCTDLHSALTLLFETWRDFAQVPV